MTEKFEIRLNLSFNITDPCNLRVLKRVVMEKGEYSLNLKLFKLLTDATVITLRHKRNSSEITFALVRNNKISI
jgi:hypothetical protein